MIQGILRRDFLPKSKWFPVKPYLKDLYSLVEKKTKNIFLSNIIISFNFIIIFIIIIFKTLIGVLRTKKFNCYQTK